MSNKNCESFSTIFINFFKVVVQFPKDFPDKLRSQILPSEVVGKKVKLKLRGKEFTGLCPFHNEKSPSFTVNDQKGFYHCFGCAAHGDIITFMMQSEGLEFPEAVQRLADDFSIEIPQVKTNFSAQKEEKIERDYLMLEKICQFFEKSFQEGQGREARNYLDKRGISKDTIKKFRLGYAPNSYEATHKFLQAEGFSDAEILKSGIIGKNDKQKLYDKFRHRVIFPITDKKNRVIAFGGRILNSEDFPKYLNSAETEIFKKNHTLYNFFHARKSIFEKKYAVIAEGYMDVISVSASGLENIVAGLGTALGENHFKELFSITDKIVICLDGDQAGVRAAKRAAEIALPLINSKKSVSFTFLPSQMDPDDYVRTYGAASLEKKFIDAIPLSQALFEFALIDVDLAQKTEISAENKAKIEEILTKKLEEIKDSTSKKYFSLFFKDRLFSLGRNSQKFDKKGQKTAKNEQNLGNLMPKIQHKPNNAADFLAKNIIAFIIKFPQLAHYQDENFDIKEVSFLSPELTQIKDLSIETIESEESVDEKKLLETLENSNQMPYIKEIRNLVAAMSHHNLIEDNMVISQKMSLLLLKELLLQVEAQYKQSLSKIDEIETYHTTINNEKIKELFAYRNSLEQKILALEKELI